MSVATKVCDFFPAFLGFPDEVVMTQYLLGAHFARTALHRAAPLAFLTRWASVSFSRAARAYEALTFELRNY